MSLALIRAALEVQLNAIAPPLATAWENAAFAPVAGTPYQAVNLLPAAPDNPETGRGYREQGIFQVTLRYPLQAGPAAAVARAALLRAAFPKNAALTNGSTVVTISRTPAIGIGAVDGDRWALPVKIQFHSNQFN